MEQKQNYADGDKPSWHRGCGWWMVGGVALSVTPANIVSWALKWGLFLRDPQMCTEGCKSGPNGSPQQCFSVVSVTHIWWERNARSLQSHISLTLYACKYDSKFIYLFIYLSLFSYISYVQLQWLCVRHWALPVRELQLNTVPERTLCRYTWGTEAAALLRCRSRYASCVDTAWLISLCCLNPKFWWVELLTERLCECLALSHHYHTSALVCSRFKNFIIR